MRLLTYILIGALFVLHQDFWLWDSHTLVLGFLPSGLAYHAVFSILAAFKLRNLNLRAWLTRCFEQCAATGGRPRPTSSGWHCRRRSSLRAGV